MLFHPSLLPMRGRCSLFSLEFSYILVQLLFLGFRGCWSLNSEGFALLKFQARLESDPYGALANWNPDDENPCNWSGVICVEDRVQVLDLNGLSLEGTLAPELGELDHLTSLKLNTNCFYGAIPKEIGGLKRLELLDLRNNKFSGPIPTELGRMSSLKRLLLCDNKFEGSIPLELRRLSFLSEFQFDEKLTSSATTGFVCINRKLGHCIWYSSLKEFYKAESSTVLFKGTLVNYLKALPLSWFKAEKDTLNSRGNNCQHSMFSSSETEVAQSVPNDLTYERRKLLEESTNLQAVAGILEDPSSQIITLPSGSFPASTKDTPLPPPSAPPPLVHTDNEPAPRVKSLKWKYIAVIPAVGVSFIVIAFVFFLVRRRGVKTIRPWKTGLSGQLQKALVTGVPKLNRGELDTACEDFSNIISTLDGCTIYKGTLSSGVEIAVAAAVVSSKEWTESSEKAYRKKIDTLSRVNHKNFVNLIGYCEDNEPFTRMMVFEYAPNGTLSEHLHVEGMEHIDWSARVRIIMGTAYCLQYMHHDLNPPVVHSKLNSSAIYLTDDYAAKVAEINFGLVPSSSPLNSSKRKNSSEDDSKNNDLPPHADAETNVYSFGILLLEIISGKPPSSKEYGHLVNWAADYLNDKSNLSKVVDPALASFEDKELEVICEVIKECTRKDRGRRPTIKDVISKLRQVISVTPEQATPRLSPLWWAELEILSAEAT